MTIRELGDICEANGLLLTEIQLAKLNKYAELLRAKNKDVNLISRKDEENILSKHILHSLSLTMLTIPGVGFEIQSRVFDLGTGGGMPGIPVKIAQPDISLVMCDSIAKKIAAVSEFSTTLNLQTLCVTGRAEELAKKKLHKGQYDVVITRAVAPLDELLIWSQYLLRKKGTLFALKGGNVEPELDRALKLQFVDSVEVSPIPLLGYDEFIKEEKKIVRVRMV